MKYDPERERQETWKEVWADRSLFPYLQYSTSGDEVVCEKCGPLDGIIKKVTDPWWKIHYPPWHEGCRCIASQLRRLPKK
jgi:SPP1 gp7 family putative phage head morphogenesis protein